MKKHYQFVFGLFQNEKFLFISCLTVIVFYFLPFVILGQNSSLLIHDNLDSNIVHVKMLLDNNKVFSCPDDQINQILNGIPRSSIYGNFEISLIWFKLFGIFWGYIFNKFLMSLIAFSGMYLLLKKHFIPDSDNMIVLSGVSLLFSLLPFWSFSMSVAGIPLVFYALLNLRIKRKKTINWLIIILFPFYSSLVTSGIFVLIILTLIIIYDSIKTKTINYSLLAGIFTLGFLYLISHFNLFYSFLFDSGYISHRVEFVSLGTTLAETIVEILRIFFFGQYHAPSLHTFILIPILIGFYLNLISKKRSNIYKVFFLFIFITSILYGLVQWTKMAPVIQFQMTYFPIQLQRFHWLHPMYWYILLAVSLTLILERYRAGFKITILILLIQGVYLFRYHELILNRVSPSFRQFFAEEQFHEIKSYIGLPQCDYRILSLGIHPSISQYNGFYTLDAYVANYPLEYKHEFRKVIKGELDRDSTSKIYFDNWGSKCYAFSSELGRNFETSTQQKVELLDFDFDVLRKMGGKYILSKVEVNTEINRRLKFLKLFENPDSYWKIYLYEIQ